MSEQALGPVMMDIDGPQLSQEDQELLQHPLVGGLILFTRNYRNREQLMQLISEVRKARPGILIAVDYEGGRVQRFREGFTRLPPMRAFGEIFDQNEMRAKTLAQACGWLLATELREAGIDLAFAPVVDVDAGVSDVIGDRAFHRDPEVICQLATAVMKGMREAGMAATAKHFPGHGHVVPDSHQELPVDDRSLEELENCDLLPYESLIESGLASVMMAHILYPAIDDRPASLSAYWIQQYLRETLGFEGTVFCDDLSMGGAAEYGSYLQRAELALEAGCDMLPICNHRAGVLEVLEGLHWQPSSGSLARLTSVRAKELGMPEDFARLHAAQSLLTGISEA